MPRSVRLADAFESRAAGIPCLVQVVSYYGGSPAVRSGPMAGPEEYAEADWVLLDRRGRRAEWLEKKLTQKDIERIDEEAVDYMRED